MPAPAKLPRETLLDAYRRMRAIREFDERMRREFEAGMQLAQRDEVFGVPLFVFRGERFWGHDRIPLLEERLAEAGLRR